MAEQTRYQFGPLERHGFLMGLNIAQFLALALGGFLSVMSLRLQPAALAVVAAMLALMAAVAVAFVPLHGRPVHEWVPVATTWLSRRALRQHRFSSAAPLLGYTSSGHAVEAPDVLRDLSILAAPVAGGEVGVIKDAREGTYAAVLSVHGQSFALLDEHSKSRMLMHWAGVLAGLAREGGAVGRVQWVERTVPDPADKIGQYLRESAVMPVTSAPVRSYLQLVEDAGPVMQQHETFVVIQVDGSRARGAIRHAGGGGEGACRVLTREVHQIALQLQSAGLDVVGILTPRMVGEVIRVAYDPAARPSIARRGLDDPATAGVMPEQAWPMATYTTWSSYRTDSAVHSTYWCAEWPRIEVGPDFLAPLLLQTSALRTVSVTMEPVSPLRAQREVQTAKITNMADQELRERAGFVTSMSTKRQQENIERRERELTDGEVDVRFSGYVTVSANNDDELLVACSEVEQQAGQARIVLRRMSGEQDIGFTYTLPLARGLR